MKKLLATLLASTMALTTIGGLVACGGDGSSGGGKEAGLKPSEFSKVTHLDDPLLDKADESDAKVAACDILVWAPEEVIPTYEAMIDDFKSNNYHNGKYSQVNVTFEPHEEGTAYTDLGNDATGGADVFFFASDHADTLMGANLLLPLRGATGSYYSAAIAQRDGAGAVDAVTKNGYAYAFPATFDNGYMLVYSTDDLTEEEASGKLDDILDKANDLNKSFMWRFNTGYYGGTFFFGAGAVPEFKGNNTDYSVFTSAKAEIGAKATIKYLTSGYTKNGTTAKFLHLGDNGAGIDGILKGNLIASVCGLWEIDIPEGMESKIGFTKLPMFTVDGQDYQMGSFFGGKYCGVNARKGNTAVSMALANFLTNGAAQQKRFEAKGSGPSNIAVSNSDAVKTSPALVALAKQVAAGGIAQQGVPDPFFGALETYAADITKAAPTVTLDNLGLANLAQAMKGIEE